MASTKGQLFEKKRLGLRTEEEATCNAVILQPLKSSIRTNIQFLLILTQLLVAPTLSPARYTVLFILLPDYFGSDSQNGGRELRAGRQSGSHFLTDPGPSTEIVKTPYV